MHNHWWAVASYPTSGTFDDDFDRSATVFLEGTVKVSLAHRPIHQNKCPQSVFAVKSSNFMSTKRTTPILQPI